MILRTKVTVCVATDGNQGRGLAYGANMAVAVWTTSIVMSAPDVPK
jgi:threonine dehydratase